MEHLQHFGLADDPFRNDPLERFQLEVPSQELALRRLDRGVRASRSLVLVTGEVGAGKSTILRKLYEELEEDVFEASMMLVLRSRVDTDWLLRRFAAQLGVEEPPLEREALVVQVYEQLTRIREDGRHAVLIIDDADALAVQDTLAELFALSKLEYEDRRLLTLVLAGTSRLAHAIDTIPGLAAQVEVRLALASLTREESAEYLRQRVEVAGGHGQVLVPDSVVALHERSEGLPGRLNVLADNALFEAFLSGRGEVVPADVEGAARGLCWGEGECEMEVPPASRSVEHDDAPAASHSGTGESLPQLGMERSPEAPEFELEVLGSPPKRREEVDDLFMDLLDD